jgi:purine-binding chemotaxis protein CheW
MSDLFVVLEVGEASYLLAGDEVRELETFTGATRVPSAAEYVAGVVHVRGKVVPVIDLRVRFGLPAVEPTLDTRVVVTELGDRSVGLVCERARHLLRIDKAQIQPPPRLVVEQTHGFVKGIVEVDKRIYLLADLERIIGEEQVHGERDLQLGDGEPRRRALPG